MVAPLTPTIIAIYIYIFSWVVVALQGRVGVIAIKVIAKKPRRLFSNDLFSNGSDFFKLYGSGPFLHSSTKQQYLLMERRSIVGCKVWGTVSGS